MGKEAFNTVISEMTKKQLEYLQKRLVMNKTDVVMLAIERLYQQTKREEEGGLYGS